MKNHFGLGAAQKQASDYYKKAMRESEKFGLKPKGKVMGLKSLGEGWRKSTKSKWLKW